MTGSGGGEGGGGGADFGMNFFAETLKYWVGLQRGQSYLMKRRCLFSLGWLPF